MLASKKNRWRVDMHDGQRQCNVCALFCPTGGEGRYRDYERMHVRFTSFQSAPEIVVLQV